MSFHHIKQNKCFYIFIGRALELQISILQGFLKYYVTLKTETVAAENLALHYRNKYILK